MEIFLGIMVFLMGLVAGSFVNMLVYRTAVKYRLKKGERKTRPYNKNRSFCDFCGRQLKWYENVPVISWLWQRGRSRCCQKPLPYSYPLIELGTALIFWINFRFFLFPSWFLLNNSQLLGFLITLFLEMVAITMLVFEADFDRRHMILPDNGIITLVVVGILMILVGRAQDSPVLSLFSALGAFGFLLLLHLITKGKGMGMGDVKYALFMGLWLGFPKIIVAFYVAFVVGALFGIGSMLRGKMSRKSVMPFGPFLILGTIVAWWWGNLVIELL